MWQIIFLVIIGHFQPPCPGRGGAPEPVLKTLSAVVLCRAGGAGGELFGARHSSLKICTSPGAGTTSAWGCLLGFAAACFQRASPAKHADHEPTWIQPISFLFRYQRATMTISGAERSERSDTSSPRHAVEGGRYFAEESDGRNSRPVDDSTSDSSADEGEMRQDAASRRIRQFFEMNRNGSPWWWDRLGGPPAPPGEGVGVAGPKRTSRPPRAAAKHARFETSMIALREWENAAMTSSATALLVRCALCSPSNGRWDYDFSRKCFLPHRSLCDEAPLTGVSPASTGRVSCRGTRFRCSRPAASPLAAWIPSSRTENPCRCSNSRSRSRPDCRHARAQRPPLPSCRFRACFARQRNGQLAPLVISQGGTVSRSPCTCSFVTVPGPPVGWREIWLRVRDQRVRAPAAWVAGRPGAPQRGRACFPFVRLSRSLVPFDCPLFLYIG